MSAVFHSPSVRAEPVEAPLRATNPSTSSGRTNLAAAPQLRASRSPFDWRSLWLALLPPVFGLGLLIGVWALVSISSASSIPSPLETFKQAVVIFSDPFYRKGPNDQGVGWNILASLERVAVGFGLAAAVGIPAGFMIGRFEF